jgi:hypothetical protein
MCNHRDNFHRVYRDARALRGVLSNDFVTSGRVEIFVSDTSRVVVGRAGDYSERPGFYAACLSSGRSTKTARRYFVERARECGRVPLPR